MLAARFGVPHRVDRRLLELSFGDWEGCSYASLENDPAFRNWTDNWQRVAPPKGESLDELVARVRDWLAEVREGNGAHLVVAHAGVMRAAQMLLGNATAAEAWKTTVPHLSPVLWRTGES
jgi:alpha-ribazole phosphatase